MARFDGVQGAKVVQSDKKVISDSTAVSTTKDVNSVFNKSKKREVQTHNESMIELYNSNIEYLEKEKQELMDRLKSGKFTEGQKKRAAKFKHNIADGVMKTGGIVMAGGMLTTTLGVVAGPAAFLGGIIAGAVGVAITVPAGMYINSQIKNLTAEDMKQYVESEIKEIDDEIAENREALKSYLPE